MPYLIRTNAFQPDFIRLVQQLDQELAIIDGEDHDFYHQYNQIDNIKYTVVLYQKGQAIGCGAI